MHESLSRRKKVEAKNGPKKSMMYDLISKGLFPPPIKIGERAVAWIDSETDAINAARIAGQSDDEIRALVKTLIGKRKNVANEILSAV